MKKLLIFIVPVYFAMIFWSCEKEKSGIIDAHYATPQLLNASVDHARFNLDSANAFITPLPGRQFAITCTIKALASTRFGTQTINQIGYTLFFPRSDSSIQSGSLATLSPGQPPTDSSYWVRGASTINFIVNYADVGNYILSLTAFNVYGNASNTLNIPITITRKNIKPHLSNLDIPDTVQIPPIAGQINAYIFSVTVADSDGYNDISRVYFYRISPNSPGAYIPIEMYDDGDFLNHGDKFAGDGIFSCAVKIEHKNTPGVNMFSFHALDHYLAEHPDVPSDSLTQAVTVIQ
ncbi:MAG: hypothetical protein ACHQQQ_05535 [Bacteroidota bacterium]